MIYLFIVVNLLFLYFFSKDDIKYNKIFNKKLKYYLIFILIFKGYEFFIMNQPIELKYYLFSIIIPFFLYYFKVWGAGDSKLLTLLFINLPSSIVFKEGLVFFMKYLNLLFIISFGYFLIEGLIYTFKYKKRKLNTKKIINKIIDITFILLFLNMLNSVISLVISNLYIRIFFLYIVSYLFINSLLKIKRIIIYFSIIIFLSLSLIYFRTFSFNSIIICLLVSYLKEIIYNSSYKLIRTTQVKEGMILSQNTIHTFCKSRVKNLPHKTLETKESQLSKSEMEAIKRWENSKYGQSFIEIIKKVPYSIFIMVTYFIIVIFYFLYL